ncbi:MAG: zf-HC2 domain-containing protein [Lachnospiraceae bacterium]|nr:zf-HC2 domain-containing protein [Lachnospiraceae bacterium]
MDCKEFERLILEFIGKKMDYAMTKRFVEHLHNCPNCKEELNIQFLIEEGLVRLEEGSAFDLQKEMRDLLGEAGRKVRFHERWLLWGKIVESLVILGVGAVVVAIICL